MTVVPARVAGVGADRRRLAGRPRRPRRTRSSSARPACSRSMPSSSPVAPRRSARWRTACPDAGLAPVDRIVGPGNAWVTAAKIEVCGEVGIDLPAGPSEGMVLAAPPADPRPRRGRPHHPGRARPGLAGHPRHDGRRLRRRRRGRGRAPSSRTRRPPRHPRARARATTAGSSSRRTLDAAIDFVNAYAPGAPLGRRRAARADGRPPPQRRLAVRRPVGARIRRRLRDRREPRPADRRPRARRPARLSVEAFGKFVQVQRIDRDGPRRRSATPSATLAEAEGLLAHRDAVEIRFEEPEPMSPTPVTFTSPDRAGLVQLGGHRRGGRRALRRSIRRRSSAST